MQIIRKLLASRSRFASAFKARSLKLSSEIRFERVHVKIGAATKREEGTTITSKNLGS